MRLCFCRFCRKLILFVGFVVHISQLCAHTLLPQPFFSNFSKNVFPVNVEMSFHFTTLHCCTMKSTPKINYSGMRWIFIIDEKWASCQWKPPTSKCFREIFVSSCFHSIGPHPQKACLSHLSLTLNIGSWGGMQCNGIDIHFLCTQLKILNLVLVLTQFFIAFNKTMLF